MKLVQIKEFNKETVTNDIAYQIFAIVGSWRGYTRQELISKGYECKERWYGKSENGGNHQEAWNNPDFKMKYHIRTFMGLTLKPIGSTSHIFSLDVDGKVICYNKHEKGDLKSWSAEEGEKRFEKSQMNLESPAHQIKLVQLYLDLGFYTIEP